MTDPNTACPHPTAPRDPVFWLLVNVWIDESVRRINQGYADSRNLSPIQAWGHHRRPDDLAEEPLNHDLKLARARCNVKVRPSAPVGTVPSNAGGGTRERTRSQPCGVFGATQAIDPNPHTGLCHHGVPESRFARNCFGHNCVESSDLDVASAHHHDVCPPWTKALHQRRALANARLRRKSLGGRQGPGNLHCACRRTRGAVGMNHRERSEPSKPTDSGLYRGALQVERGTSVRRRGDLDDGSRRIHPLVECQR